MPVNSDRLTRPLVVGALSAAFAGVVAPGAVLAGPEAPVTPDSSLSRAERLADAGRLVEARAVLLRAVRSETPVPAAEHDGAVQLLDRVERRIRQADPGDISLQKAELAIAEGDLRLAERHAAAVAARADASGDLKSRAASLNADITRLRAEMAPRVGPTLKQAVADFDAGRYAQAKAALSAVYRSGATLTDDDRRTMDTYQVRIVQLEQANGRLFDTDTASAGMLQPGTVRRGEETTRPANAPSKPAPSNPAPSDNTMRPVESTTPAAAPAPAASPAPATPAPATPAPATPAPTGTRIQPADQPGTMQPSQPSQPTPPPADPNPGNMGPGSGAPEQPLPQDQLIQMALRAEAQRILAEADAAFNEGRYPEAERKYTLVTTAHRQYLTPEDVRGAETRLAEARVRMRQAGGIGETAVMQQALIRERATAEFNNEMEQARRALDAGEIATARDLNARARLTAERAREAFNATEHAEMLARADELRAAIDRADEAGRARAATEQERRLRDEAARTQQNLRSEKDRKVYEGIDRARQLQREQKYRESLQVVEQVLFLDPNNPTAEFLRELLMDVIVYEEFYKIQELKRRGFQQMELDAQDPLIAPRRFMNFPSDWPNKTFQRTDTGAFADSPENQSTRAALNGKLVPASFEENTLASVIDWLAQTTGQNFDVEWESLRPLGIEPTTTVSLNLRNVSASTVLNKVLAHLGRDQAKAAWTINEGIVTIASEDSIKRHTATHLYNITDLLLEIPDFTDVPQVDLQSAIGQGGKNGAGASPFRMASERKDNRAPREERVRKIVDLVQATIDADSWRDNGGDVGSINELNGSLIITSTPANHREIAGLLSKLRDIRSMQINVEARFIVVNQDFFEQIGIDLDIYFNANNNQIVAAQAVDPTILPSDFFDFGSGGGLVRNVTGQEPTGGTTTPGTRTTQGVIPANNWSPIGAVGNSLGLGSLLAADNTFANTVLGTAPALGVAASFLDDIQVDFLLRATQADRRTVTLTAPRLTLTNGQTSNVYVATQRAFVSDLEVVTGDSAVGFDPVPGTLIEGVILLVEAVITSDRRYVTMNVDTSVNKIDRLDPAGVTAVVGGQLVNSATTQSFFQLPTTTTTRVQTTVTVPDEGTVLLGGQRLVTELEIETGVPVLSKLPVLNRFFTNRIEAKTEQTLIILIKPTIMIQAEEEEKNFPGLLDTMRSGMGG